MKMQVDIRVEGCTHQMLMGKGSNCFFKRKRGNQLNLFSTTLSPGVRETYFAERVEKDAISFFWSFWIIFACREGLIWRLFQRERLEQSFFG